jgi:hypothetical protein
MLTRTTAVATAIMIAGAALVGAGCSTENTPVAEVVAMAEGESWLRWVDQDSLATAYQRASAELQERRPQERWIADVGNARRLLGEVVARRMNTRRYEDDPEGFVAGTYVVLSFTTDFTERQDVEELLVMKLTDGAWRTARYIIDPAP